MADEQLTREEVATLLAAHSAAAGAPAAGATGLAPLPAALVRTLAVLHEQWAQRAAAQLTTLVRCPVRARLAALRPATCGEFAAQLAGPVCASVVSTDPPAGRWLLVLDGDLLHLLVECMLGGGRRVASADRAPTDIELRLASRAASVLVESLAAAWQGYTAVALTIDRTERSVRAAIPSSAERIAWLRCEVCLGASRGLAHLAVPAGALSSLLEPRHDAAPPACGPQPAESAAMVELVARLAQSKIAPADAAQLQVGDVLTTEQPLTAPVAILQDGKTRFVARVGAAGGYKAVRIEDPAEGVDGPQPGAT